VLVGLCACNSTSPTIPPSMTMRPEETVTPPVEVTPTLSHLSTATFTPSPLACLSQPGQIESGSLELKPPLEFLVYLPPCYNEQADRHYQVLYLLHGQTYTDDQWVRLGAPTIADRLVISGEVLPFVMVFPDDRYWNLPAGELFGSRLLDNLIPYIDEHYRSLPDREHRAIGGLSRGGGWAIRLGLTRWDLFETIGLHSPAIFREDGRQLENWLEAIPPESWPRLWLDVGDHDQELGYDRQFDDLLTRHDIPHEWHLYAGEHDEVYWQTHVEEYLRWYAAGWETVRGNP